MGWKIFSAGVKIAFLQADNVEKEMQLCAAPNRDIRVQLAKLIGLKDSQSMKVVKPEFGDVRAPRQSFSMVDRVKREELYFVRRQLDNCLLTRARSADKSDDRSRVFDNTVVEGVIGLCVDDLMGDGENVLP